MTQKEQELDLDALGADGITQTDGDIVAAQVPTSISTIDDTYQQYTRRAWLLDFSHSMNDNIFSLNKTRQSQKKIDLLKEVVGANMDEKIAKYGDSVFLQIFEFGGDVSEFTADTLFKLKNRMQEQGAWHGDTNIPGALNHGIQVCEQNPSPVGTHQVLMVTDALDWRAVNADTEFLPRCKQHNIIVDVIWIRSGFSSGGDEVVAALRRLCEGTGGKFVEASTIEDVRRGFIAGANRLCLPPATTKITAGGN